MNQIPLSPLKLCCVWRAKALFVDSLAVLRVLHTTCLTTNQPGFVSLEVMLNGNERDCCTAIYYIVILVPFGSFTSWLKGLLPNHTCSLTRN